MDIRVQEVSKAMNYLKKFDGKTITIEWDKIVDLVRDGKVKDISNELKRGIVSYIIKGRSLLLDADGQKYECIARSSPPIIPLQITVEKYEGD